MAFLSPGDLPNPGIEPMSLSLLALVGRFFTTGAVWTKHSLINVCWMNTWVQIHHGLLISSSDEEPWAGLLFLATRNTIRSRVAGLEGVFILNSPHPMPSHPFPLPPSLPSLSPSLSLCLFFHTFYIYTIQGICNIPHRQRKRRIFMFLEAPHQLTMNEIFLKGISAEALIPEQISRTSDHLFLMYFYLTGIHGVSGLCQPQW